MYTRTAAFDAAVQQSHTVVITADVMLGGMVVPNGANLPVKAGSLTIDGGAGVRRRGNLTIIDGDGLLTAGGSSAVLSPYGREVRIRRGLRLPDGTTETIVVATLRIAGVPKASNAGGREIKITAYDRARTISRARFEEPYTIAAGTNYAIAIGDLLRSRLPTVSTSFITTSRVTPLLVFDQGGDPWEQAQKMATAIGCDLFFDPMGTAVLIPTPDPAALLSSWTYATGGTTMVSAVEQDLTDDPGYNGVVVDGEPPNAPPVHVVVYDNDNTSPTYAAGPYNRVPYFYKSPLVATLDQATDAANALLRANKGSTEQVKITTIPHPAHEVADMVRVTAADYAVDDNYVVDSITMPLDLGLMTLSMRKRRV